VYALRIFRDTLLFFKDYDLVQILSPVFYISKTIMILGVCISIYQRLTFVPSVSQVGGENDSVSGEGRGGMM
jgi:hypothetical protein